MPALPSNVLRPRSRMTLLTGAIVRCHESTVVAAVAAAGGDGRRPGGLFESRGEDPRWLGARGGDSGRSHSTFAGRIPRRGSWGDETEMPGRRLLVRPQRWDRCGQSGHQKRRVRGGGRPAGHADNGGRVGGYE